MVEIYPLAYLSHTLKGQRVDIHACPESTCGDVRHVPDNSDPAGGLIERGSEYGVITIEKRINPINKEERNPFLLVYRMLNESDQSCRQFFFLPSQRVMRKGAFGSSRNYPAS
jgi:hypothetical protein